GGGRPGVRGGHHRRGDDHPVDAGRGALGRPAAEAEPAKVARPLLHPVTARQMICRSLARRIASLRRLAASLRRMARTCVRTVLTETYIWRAISSVESSSDRWTRTSCSFSVSGSMSTD